MACNLFVIQVFSSAIKRRVLTMERTKHVPLKPIQMDVFSLSIMKVEPIFAHFLNNKIFCVEQKKEESYKITHSRL